MGEFIFDVLNMYQKEKIYPFHMPGHKRSMSFFQDNLLQYDVTEFEETDNLHQANGPILNSQKRAAEVFGANESFFLVNGSTSGIIAAILATVSENDEIMICRGCHRSVYSGLIFSGARPVYVYPNITKYNIQGGFLLEDIKKKLKTNPLVKAVIITSPTYEGFVQDIAKIAEEVHNQGKVLIVDEAHGSHFKFHSKFPKTALECGADIVINSLHKTMPAIGQSSILHVNGNLVDIEKIKFYLSILQTSSPSYIILCGIDKLIANLYRGKLNYNIYIENLLHFREVCRGLKRINLIGHEIQSEMGIIDFDISRLVFDLNKTDMNGSDAEKILRDKYKMQIEMSGVKHIIAISTVADTKQAFHMLQNALFELDELYGSKYYMVHNIKFNFPQLKMKYSPKEVLSLETEYMDLNESVGCIAADFIIPYPPGIPIIVPGEEINNDVLQEIEDLKTNNIKFVGLNQKIKIIKR